MYGHPWSRLGGWAHDPWVGLRCRAGWGSAKAVDDHCVGPLVLSRTRASKAASGVPVTE